MSGMTIVALIGWGLALFTLGGWAASRATVKGIERSIKMLQEQQLREIEAIKDGAMLRAKLVRVEQEAEAQPVETPGCAPPPRRVSGHKGEGGVTVSAGSNHGTIEL